MTRKNFIAAAAFAASLAVPAAAHAANAYTSGEVNMRAGPSTGFPRITTLPEGVGVTIYGCTRGWSWCDTSWRGLRGWVSARYLESLYAGRRVYLPEYAPRLDLPIISFSFGTYWDRWYRDRPWYRERDRWDRAWRDDDLADRFEMQTRSSAAIELDRTRLRTPADEAPPGIRKKGRGFCPPGQAKKGRC